MKTNLLFLFFIFLFSQLTAQNDAFLPGGFITFGVSKQYNFNKKSPANLLSSLPKSCILYEYNVDFFYRLRWSLFLAVRSGETANRDESKMIDYFEKKFMGNYIFAPIQNKDNIPTTQFLLGGRYKKGINRFQLQPGLALGITLIKNYPFEVAAKAPNSNQLYRSVAAFDRSIKIPKGAFTLQITNDLFYRITKYRIWLYASGALWMVSLPSNRIAIKTTDEITQETNIDYLKLNKIRIFGALSLGISFRFGAH